MSDFSNWRKVRTRKLHDCNGCFKRIPVGAVVTFGSGKFEGGMFNCYLCDECDDYIERNPEVMQEGFSDGDIGMLREEERA